MKRDELAGNLEALLETGPLAHCGPSGLALEAHDEGAILVAA